MKFTAGLLVGAQMWIKCLLSYFMFIIIYCNVMKMFAPLVILLDLKDQLYIFLTMFVTNIFTSTAQK